MDNDSQVVALEVNSVIAQAEAMKSLPIPFQFSELMEITVDYFLGQASEFAEDVQLEFSRHLCQLGSADRIENDLELKHASEFRVSQVSFKAVSRRERDEKLVARTGIEPVFQP
jgi:hypothetical protein